MNLHSRFQCLEMFNRRRLIRCAFLYFLVFFIVCFCYLTKLDSSPSSSIHRLAVIVPYRNRSDELKVFLPHLHSFLTSQSIEHRFFIINQIDKHRFNRAALINIGFLQSQTWADYLVMHDVDLLPLNLEQLSYRFPRKGPVHLASPEYHPIYHYPKYVGGILMIKTEDFQRINGMCPLYWGWGTEDDNFYLRMKLDGMRIYRPHNLSTNRSNTFRHVHNRNVHKRDTAKYGKQKDEGQKLRPETGWNTTKYQIINEETRITNEGIKYQMFDVNIVCDDLITPWCDHPNEFLR